MISIKSYPVSGSECVFREQGKLLGRREQEKLPSFIQPFIQQTSSVGFCARDSEMKIQFLSGRSWELLLRSLILIPCDLLVIRACAGRGGMQGALEGGTGRLMGGRSLGAKMSSLLTPSRHVSVRLIFYYQGCTVTAGLWEVE